MFAFLGLSLNMNTIKLILFFVIVFFTTVEAQVENNPNFMLPRGRSPLPKINKRPGVKPARTVADTAQEFWIENNCTYPPKAFFAMFRDACDVRLLSKTFPAGVCQAFFNSSKNLCKLEGAGEDEIQTMLSIHELQMGMDDDEVCDTLAEMKENNPNLFPKMSDFTGKDTWFESIASLIFSPETCSTACSMGNMHPVCFGYMLNYNYIGDLFTPRSELEMDEEKIEKEENESNQDEKEKQKENKIAFSKEKIAPDDLENSRIDDSSNLNKTPISLVDLLDLESMGLDDSAAAQDDPVDYILNPDEPIANLPQFSEEFLMKIGNVPVNRHKLRGYVNQMDRSEEMPMLAVVLTISGILAAVCFFLLFSVRKKIGIYMRFMRQKRHHNWNYERVFAVQPDDDEYYE